MLLITETGIETTPFFIFDTTKHKNYCDCYRNYIIYVT
jgi:hypothetical protein